MVLLTLAFISLSPKTPTTQQTLEKPDLEILSQKTQSFETQNVSLPQNYPASLPVYSTNYSQDITESAPEISTKLGFTNPPIDVSDALSGNGQLYTNENNDALIIYPRNFTYQRIVNNPTDNNFGNVEKDKKDALNLISSLGLPSDFAPQSREVYLKATDDFLEETEDPAEASLLKITFYYQISGLPVFNPKYLVSATFNKAGQLTNLTYFSLPLGSASNAYQITTPQQALQELQNGTASLIELAPPNNYTVPPQNIKSASLESAELAYYLSPGAQTMQPVWIFKGTGDQGLELSYAVPAIDQKHFTRP